MKTYVLTISKIFPKTHPKAGYKTYFLYDIEHRTKIHTIRGNYDLWAKRFEEIEKGNAKLSIRYWTGIPYKSRQFTYKELTKDDGIGLQKLTFKEMIFTYQPTLTQIKNGYHRIWVPDLTDVNTLAQNDGLSFEDFQHWFNSYDLSKPLALIHFTKHRY